MQLQGRSNKPEFYEVDMYLSDDKPDERIGGILFVDISLASYMEKSQLTYPH